MTQYPLFVPICGICATPHRKCDSFATTLPSPCTSAQTNQTNAPNNGVAWVLETGGSHGWGVVFACVGVSICLISLRRRVQNPSLMERGGDPARTQNPLPHGARRGALATPLG